MTDFQRYTEEASIGQKRKARIFRWVSHLKFDVWD